MLVSAVLAFPTSVPLLNGLTSVAVRSNALLTIAVLLMPLVNGVVLGVAAGLVVDLTRRILRRSRR
jgi:hypothetical protein